MFNFSEDCDYKDNYETCDLCLEVIKKEFLEHHVLGPTCISKYKK